MGEVNYGGLAAPSRLLPECRVIKIGGQSVIDRGAAAVLPLMSEVRQALDRGFKLVICTGAGTRARHAYSVASGLGLPPGVLACLGAGVAMQNAMMLMWLLADRGIPLLAPMQAVDIPFRIAQSGAVIIPGMPPYAFWERAPEIGVIPPHRTDTGCYLLAETLGAEEIIYVKDENGLFTDNPKTCHNVKAPTFIPRISVAELIDRNLPDLVIEPPVLHFMLRAHHCRRVHVINGLEPGNLLRALGGEHVGTIIEV